LVGEADFLDTLRRAAWQAGRSLQVLRVSGAGADHPFLAHAPEGRYLKAVFGRVEGSGPGPREARLSGTADGALPTT
jgi:23S rRNA (cytosine1962-C5)-methyltransferase